MIAPPPGNGADRGSEHGPNRGSNHGSNQAIRAINYFALLAAAVAILVLLKIIVISTLIGLGIGVLLAPPLRRFQRRFKLPRAAGAGVVALVTIAVLGGVGYGIYYIAESQIMSLWERMPQIIDKLQTLANNVTARYPWISDGASSFNVADTAKTFGEKFFRGAWSGVSVLGALVFAFIIGLYTSVEAETYYHGAIEAFPQRHRAAAQRYFKQSAVTIRNWFRAQLLDMAIVGSLTAVGLWVVGVDYWLLFGLFTALLGIIPYVGIAIVVVFASLVTLASDPSLVGWVIGVFVLTQQLEGHVILPLVMREQASLPAVPLLVFMLVIGSWGGLLGVLMAPPLFAMLLLAYRSFYLPRMRQATAETDAS